MTKEQVIERFCALSHKVMAERFKYQIPADCFCGGLKNSLGLGFQAFDERVLEFIEEAVNNALPAGSRIAKYKEEP